MWNEALSYMYILYIVSCNLVIFLSFCHANESLSDNQHAKRHYENLPMQYRDFLCVHVRKVQEGKDLEKAQSEKDSHSKNRNGKKLN